MSLNLTLLKPRLRNWNSQDNRFADPRTDSFPQRSPSPSLKTLLFLVLHLFLSLTQAQFYSFFLSYLSSHAQKVAAYIAEWVQSQKIIEWEILSLLLLLALRRVIQVKVQAPSLQTIQWVILIVLYNLMFSQISG